MLVSRIKKREFIDLGELLPEYIREMFIINQKGKSAKKPPVVENPVDWMLAFSCLSSVLISAQQSSGLILYQASILWLVWDFPGHGLPIIDLFGRKWLHPATRIMGR